MAYFPVSMSVWNRFWPLSGLNMFILRSRFMSMSLLGVKDCLPLGGVTSKETPVLCISQHNSRRYYALVRICL